uniref:Uncharacterized protein n=1 Tax=Anopheles minimus TaxID=112268 RepID=A0A182WHE1_9DIPT
MRLSWSFLRLVLIAWVLVAGSVLLEQATGEQAEDIARSLGVSDVNDWDIRSLYRVRFQHVTKRPPPGQRAAERKSKLASRWTALRERIAELFPSRHTNPRTVVTFDKIATDFVNVGIVKLAKALDPPKTTPKSRTGKKGKVSTVVEPRPDVTVADVEDVTSPTKPARLDVRPKRRVTLLVDLPDFDLQDFDGLVEANLGEENERRELSKTTVSKSSERSSPQEFQLPDPPQRLVADSPCAGSTAAQGGVISKFLLLIATTIISMFGQSCKCNVELALRRRMRILGALYLFFLVQGDVGTLAGEEQGKGEVLTRRKRGWSWSSGSSKKVTERPIGWNFNNTPVQQQQYVPQQTVYVPVPQYRSSYTVKFGRPTQSMTRQLVKAALAVGVVGAVSAYSKPVQPSTKSPSQRAAEREKRRQQRLSRRSTTTAIPPVDGNATTTTAVPLAAPELIPVMVQDANKLFQIVYVRRDQIPPGGIPIATQMPFPPGTTMPGVQQQPFPFGPGAQQQQYPAGPGAQPGQYPLGYGAQPQQYPLGYGAQPQQYPPGYGAQPQPYPGPGTQQYPLGPGDQQQPYPQGPGDQPQLQQPSPDTQPQLQAPLVNYVTPPTVPVLPVPPAQS